MSAPRLSGVSSPPFHGFDGRAVYRFEFRRLPQVFGRFRSGARASISPTIHSMSRRVSETPAAIAGDIRRLSWSLQ